MNLSISKETNHKSICRVCLVNTEDTLELFTETKDATSILENIYLCFQITLSNSQLDYPDKICNDCLSELNAANNFRNKCITFNERFACINQNLVSDKIDTLSTKNKNVKLEHYEDSEESNQFCQTPNSTEGAKYSLKNKQMKYDDKFECFDCGKILKTKASLLKHMVSMHQRRKHIGKVTGFGAARQYHCTTCSYCTPHSQTLVNHMRRHDGRRPYSCHCGKSFTQSTGLTAHEKTHSDTTYFTCSKCGKQFKHAYSLKRHLIVHENGSFICYVCHKVLKTKQSLQDHIQRHYNIRNFSCEDCGDTFVTSSELIHHRKKHSFDKKIECHLCGYKTQDKKSLILHLKRRINSYIII